MRALWVVTPPFLRGFIIPGPLGSQQLATTEGKCAHFNTKSRCIIPPRHTWGGYIIYIFFVLRVLTYDEMNVGIPRDWEVIRVSFSLLNERNGEQKTPTADDVEHPSWFFGSDKWSFNKVIWTDDSWLLWANSMSSMIHVWLSNDCLIIVSFLPQLEPYPLERLCKHLEMFPLCVGC